MLKTRIATAIWGIPLLLGALHLGGVFWQGLIFVLAGLALGEYLKMMRIRGSRTLTVPAYIAAGLILLGALWGFNLILLGCAGLLIMMVVLVIRYPHYQVDDLALSLTGSWYCGLFSLALLMRETRSGESLLFLALLLTWSSDIGGYAFGRMWGKKKLTPQLSPAKTWEGAVGGLLFSVFTALMFSAWVAHLQWPWWYAVLLGAAASIAAQIGDLWESSIKRYAGVKDAGAILPGHGGILDRFDSLLLVLPVMYCVQLMAG